MAIGFHRNVSLSVFDYSLSKVVFTIPNPSGDKFPMKIVSLREGGRFSNDKYSKVALPSNTFILQDDRGISVIDIEKKKGTLI